VEVGNTFLDNGKLAAAVVVLVAVEQMELMGVQ